MHLLSVFRQLPISLLILALVTSAGPVALRDHELPQLTPASFPQVTTSGLAFVEFYSPACRHCQNFAPTWELLVDKAKTSMPNVVIAQVNCAMYGGMRQQSRTILGSNCLS